jgi:hypothetical protein
MTVWLQALVLLGGVAASQPSTLVVEGACEDTEALRERLATLVTTPSAALGSVRLHAEQDGNIWRARIAFDVDGVPYERELAAESCAALYEASALIVALTVQPADTPVADDEPAVPVPDASPAELVQRPAPDPLDDSRRVDDANEPAEAPPPPRRRTPAATELGGRVQAGGGVAVAVLHLVHPMLTAGGAVTGRRWAAGLDALYLTPVADEIAPRVRAVVQMLGASGRGCAVWRLLDDRLAVPVCAGLAVGRSWGRGEGEAIAGRRGHETWVAALLGPRLQLRARWGGELWLTTELVVPLRRLNFVIDEIGPACCEQPLGALISVGAGWWGPRQRN